MDDDLNGRQPQWKTTSIEDELKRRSPLLEEDLNGRRPHWKKSLMEDKLDGRQP